MECIGTFAHLSHILMFASNANEKKEENNVRSTAKIVMRNSKVDIIVEKNVKVETK